MNVIHAKGRQEETKTIDGPISFPLVNSNMIIVPHYDALVLTLCIKGFDVHRVLIDPGNRLVAITGIRAYETLFRNAELSQADPLRFQRLDYHNTRRCRSPCEGWASDSTGSIFNCRRLRTLQHHNREGLTALDESYPFNLPPNCQLFD